MLKLLLLYPAEATALLTTLALLLRVRVPSWWAALVCLWCVLAAIARATCYPPDEGWDLQVFWEAGRVVLAGGDPYGLRGLVNPPTALPLFAAFGSSSFDTTLLWWTAVNLVGCLTLVFVAYRTLLVQDETQDWRVSGPALAVLTGVVAFSYACRFGIDAGQLALLTTFCLLAALCAQARGRPVWAGIFLAVGTIKTATMLPFLMLFLRKKDWPAWLSMAATSLGLCVLTTSPLELADRCRACLDNIAVLKQPGRVNDYAYDNVTATDVIALDHLCYRVGLRDRSLIQATQLAVTALLGLWVLWLVAGPRPLPRAAACSLVAFYAALFLYHRHYDMVILALPLVYSAGRAMADRGPTRWLHVGSAVAVLMVLWLRRDALAYVTARITAEAGGNLFLEAVVLPYGDWAVLAGMVAFAVGERIRQPKSVLEPRQVPDRGAGVLACP